MGSWITSYYFNFFHDDKKNCHYEKITYVVFNDTQAYLKQPLSTRVTEYRKK